MKIIIKYIIYITLALVIAYGGVTLVGRWTEPDAGTSGVDNRATTIPEFSIVAFGDSLTAGYGLAYEESYPAQLEHVLRDGGYSVVVHNAGVSGETTAGNLERAPRVRDMNPDVVILGIGGNDALRVLPVETARENITSTIRILQEGTDAPRIILLRMQAPLNGGFAYKAAFDDMYDEIGEEFDIPVVPFLVFEVFRSREYMQRDGIHPNAAGYAFLIDKYVRPAVEDALDV